MEAILGLPTSTSVEASSRPFSLWLPSRGAFRQHQRPGRVHFKSPWGGGGGGRRPYTLVVEAKRRRRGGNNTNVNKKPLPHFAVPKPDESTWFFPEAELVKQKEVQEDGKVLPEFADAEEENYDEFLTLQRESALNLRQMRHYEVVYLIHQDKTDEVESINTKIQDFIRERKGRIYRLNHWGLRRLAYRIKKTTEAYYILMNFELEAKSTNDFKNLLDRDGRIIRHLVMKRKHAITEYCPPPPEFHTLRGSMMDEDDEFDDDDDAIVNVDDEDDAEYDDEYEDEDDEEYDEEDDEEYEDEDDDEYDDEEDAEDDDEEDVEQEDKHDAEHKDEDDAKGENKDGADKEKDNVVVVDDEDGEASPKWTKRSVAKKGKRQP